MQTEYTEVSTFIHEFGHSLGLPDVYARQTSNSTASWEAMSATASPEPQEMSTWARMVLGWMRPCVVQPPGLGGKKTGTVYLKTMNDWSGKVGYQPAKDVCDAAMVVLPPKFRDIKMGPLGENNGRQVAYTGQGNSMNRSLSRRFDLHSVPTDTALLMSLDAWFVIEAEWDYLYVEAAAQGEAFRRLMPIDKSSIADKNSVMPSGKGHDGAGTIPGFTGRSGDRDGDGKVELAVGCDPGKQRALAEDRIGQQEADPCEAAQWISAQFDLSEYRGHDVTVRFTYFTDGAAVEDGALLDNIAIPAIAFREDFEGPELENWDNRGFTLSTGNHHLAVPHFYLLEYRDPYERFASVKNYDKSLSHPGFTFFPDKEGGMRAVNINYRPGVLMWYYNGEYLWSQNDPAETGPGRGFLLLVDSTPQEFLLPALPAKYYRQTDDWSHWDLDTSAQELLRKAFVDTMCFQRRPAYYSTDVAPADRQGCASEVDQGLPPMEALSWNGRQLMYGYTIINELLPGEQRRARKSGSTLFDLRIRDGKTQYRLYDRMLRNRHSADAPFALQTFANGVEFYRGENGEMVRESASPFTAVSEFSDARPNLYQNPKLPFGGADIPEEGFSYQLYPVDKNEPVSSKIRLKYDWRHISDK
jgi:immune inhibitor A